MPFSIRVHFLCTFTICLFLTTTIYSQTYSKAQRKKVYYSKEQIAMEKEWAMTRTYPVPKLSDSEFFNLLKPYVSYPYLGMKNFESHRTILSMMIDTSGKIDSLKIVSLPFPIFDSIAYKAILKTSGYWQSGVTGFKKKKMEIHFPVTFEMVVDSNVVHFYVSFFYRFRSFLTESTNTFPAFMIEEEYDDDDTIVSYAAREFSILVHPDSLIQKKYGRLEFGLEIDSNGQASNIHQMQFLSPYVDSIGLTELISKKWKPAQKNGIRVPSYKIISIFYSWESFELNNYKSFELIPPVVELDSAQNCFKNEKYDEALSKWNEVAEWYFEEPSVFYNKALTEVKLKKFENACDDFQRCYELSEQYGYPQGLTAEKITTILKENCQ